MTLESVIFVNKCQIILFFFYFSPLLPYVTTLDENNKNKEA